LLFGPLKGRLSYNVQYERDAPEGQKRTDTVSRASLVYAF
jgi:putative salt-induced outer membrane protein